MLRGRIARKVLAAALLLHFAILCLGSLPWSRFIAALYPYYSWYPRWTGQDQNWGMYQYPSHESSEFQLIARLPDGREVEPWGMPHEMSSREFYFLESLFLRPDGEALAQRFLGVMRARWPSEPRPKALLLRRTTQRINDYADVPVKGAYDGKFERREIERRW